MKTNNQKPEAVVSRGTLINGSVCLCCAAFSACLLLKPYGSHFDDLGFVFTVILLASPALFVGFVYSIVEVFQRKWTAVNGIFLSLACIPTFLWLVNGIESFKHFQMD